MWSNGILKRSLSAAIDNSTYSSSATNYGSDTRIKRNNNRSIRDKAEFRGNDQHDKALATARGASNNLLLQSNRVSGSLHNNNNNNKKPHQPTLYKPSIYSYTCRGAYVAYSDYRGRAFDDETASNSMSEQTVNNHKGVSEGICHGFRTKLALLQDMEPDTRIGALKRFTSLEEYDDYDDNVYLEDDTADSSSGRSNGDSGNAGKGLDGQQAATKSILVSPALIFQNASTDGMTQTDDGILPEEELIRHQQWKCYGTTKVDYLILKNLVTGEQKIAAVVPRNTGLSVRIIEATAGSNHHQERNRSSSSQVINKIASISLFWLNFLITFDYVEEEREDDLSTKHETNRVENYEETDLPKDKSITVRGDGMQPRTSSLQMELIKKSIQLTANFSLKVWEHVKHNVSWIYTNIQDDFPSRTYQAGLKIVNHMPKTIYSTAAFMNKIANFLLKRMLEDDDDDDDDNSHK